MFPTNQLSSALIMASNVLSACFPQFFYPADRIHKSFYVLISFIAFYFFQLVQQFQHRFQFPFLSFFYYLLHYFPDIFFR